MGMLQATAELIPLQRCTLQTKWAVLDLPNLISSWGQAISAHSASDRRYSALDRAGLGVDGSTSTAAAPQLKLCSYTSLLGWGDHLLPDFRADHKVDGHGIITSHQLPGAVRSREGHRLLAGSSQRPSCSCFIGPFNGVRFSRAREAYTLGSYV